jgi:hypothetical protein
MGGETGGQLMHSVVRDSVTMPAGQGAERWLQASASGAFNMEEGLALETGAGPSC